MLVRSESSPRQATTTRSGAGRAFRFALLTHDGVHVLGEVNLFPRSAAGRVPLAEADHVELGYWLDATATGKGLATEAAGALLAVATSPPRDDARGYPLRRRQRCKCRGPAAARLPSGGRRGGTAGLAENELTYNVRREIVDAYLVAVDSVRAAFKKP